MSPAPSNGRPFRSRSRRTLQETVCLLLDNRGSCWPVSVAGTVNGVRAAMPECDLTDDELADLIAIASLERGLSVTFDRDLLEADDREAAFA